MQELQTAGVRPVAISVDPPADSAKLCKDVGYTFTFLSDPKLDAVRRYDLVHHGGGPDGHDIARPAEFLVDSSGIVRWENFAEDIRIRARADDMLAAARKIN